jgi:hypothetical protein
MTRAETDIQNSLGDKPYLKSLDLLDRELTRLISQRSHAAISWHELESMEKGQSPKWLAGPPTTTIDGTRQKCISSTLELKNIVTEILDSGLLDRVKEECQNLRTGIDNYANVLKS